MRIAKVADAEVADDIDALARVALHAYRKFAEIDRQPIPQDWNYLDPHHKAMWRAAVLAVRDAILPDGVQDVTGTTIEASSTPR